MGQGLQETWVGWVRVPMASVCPSVIPQTILHCPTQPGKLQTSDIREIHSRSSAQCNSAPAGDSLDVLLWAVVLLGGSHLPLMLACVLGARWVRLNCRRRSLGNSARWLPRPTVCIQCLKGLAVSTAGIEVQYRS